VDPTRLVVKAIQPSRITAESYLDVVMLALREGGQEPIDSEYTKVRTA
jgi:hypothetical protein